VKLRISGEHFDQVVVHGSIKLLLESPGKLRLVEVASVHLKDVGVNAGRGVLDLDGDLDGVLLGGGGEGEQGVLVERELREHAVQAFVRRWHAKILAEEAGDDARRHTSRTAFYS
jgi:hypothetical protein